MKKYIILIIIIILLGAGGAYYFWMLKSGAVAPQNGGLPVITYRVEPTSLSDDIVAVGTLAANEGLTIRSEIAGKVENIQFAEGQEVHKGDLILEIDDRSYQQEVERTKASYELAKSTFQRQNDLSKMGATSKQARDQATSAFLESKAAYEKANIDYEKTKIMAPFDGIIGLRAISIGNYLSVGDVITELVAINPVKVEFTVPEKYFSVLQNGLQLYITVDAWPNKEFAGSLYAINPNINPDTRNITAKALIPNSDNMLRPGMFAYVTIHVSINDNALMVPEESLIQDAQKTSVVTVVDGKAKTVEVKIGTHKNGMTEIVSGLQAGDLVISAGHMKVRDGMPVTSIPDERQASPKVEEIKENQELKN
jgi:membrane fusion protein (multidrug efflux system)